MKITSGPAIERSGDLAAMLSNLGHGDVLFIDEIHRIARPAEELLYMAMEDFRVDVVVGKGPGATAIPLEINPFTLVGATTRAGLLTGPLRDRFGFVGQMEFYEPSDLELVLAAAPRCWAWSSPRTGPRRSPVGPAGRRASPTGCCAGFATTRRSRPTAGSPARSPRPLALYDVDVLGLDRLDRAVLDALVVRFGGGPVGVSTLAVAVGEEPNTVEEVCEPFLVRAGLLARTPRGRSRPRLRGVTWGIRCPAAESSSVGPVGDCSVGGRGPVAPAAHRVPRVRRQSPCSAHRLRPAGAQLVRPLPCASRPVA